MDEEKKNIILGALKRAFDTHPQAWEDYHTLGAVVNDCANFIDQKPIALYDGLSNGFVPSCRAIEEVLRKEKKPDLLEDFRNIMDIIDEMRGLRINTSGFIENVILITSDFLMIMEEIQASDEKFSPTRGKR